jgi:hypothetical protein
MSRRASCCCGRPTPQQSYLCRVCTDAYAAALQAVPTIGYELAVTLARQRRFSDDPVSRDGGLPYDTGASAALARLRAELVGLVRLCVAERVSSTDYRHRLPADTLSSMSRWLRWRVDGVAARPWAGDALGLVAVVAACERVVDRPVPRSYAGPCDVCGADLYALPGRTELRCRRCRAGYDLAARRADLLRRAHDRLATSTDIARGLSSLDLPVSPERLRQWHHRGRLLQRGHDRRGRPLYRVGDVVELLLESVSARGLAQPRAGVSR